MKTAHVQVKEESGSEWGVLCGEGPRGVPPSMVKVFPGYSQCEAGLRRAPAAALGVRAGRALSFSGRRRSRLFSFAVEVHALQVLAELAGAGHHSALWGDVGDCVPPARTVTADELRVRGLHVHHLSTHPASITP